MSRLVLTVKPAPKITTIVRGIGQPGPQGPAGQGFSQIASGTILGNGLGDPALPQALTAAAARSVMNAASLAGNSFSGKQTFTGTDHVGLCLHSLSTAQYNALAATNGDLFRDSTTDRIDARLNRGTVELVDTAGGQTINGALGVTSNLTVNGTVLLQTSGSAEVVSRTTTNNNSTFTVWANGSCFGYFGRISGNHGLHTGSGSAVLTYDQSSNITCAANVTANGTINAQGSQFFFNAANSTRVARATGATGRLQIYRPNDPATVSVEFGGGNDEIRIRGGLGSLNHTGAQFQISSAGTMTLGCTGALTLVSNGSTAQTVTGANTVFGGTINYTNIDFPELVTNGDFSVGTGWSLGAGWTISGGVAVATGVVSFADIQQNLPAVELGRTYVVQFTITRTGGTGLQVYIGTSGSSFSLVGQVNVTGVYSFLFHKNSFDTARTLLFRGASDFTGTIDNVSVRRAF